VNWGYIYLLLGLGSFSLLGVFSKIADLKRCRPTALWVMLGFWAAGMSLLAARLFGPPLARTPATVIQIALPFGAVAAVAGVAFQTGIRYGKLATSWLIINFSAAVPTLASILIYRERIHARHALALALMGISVLLLWKDRQEDERQARHVAEMDADRAIR